ncbi:zinc finger CCCH domain-containing protein 56-like [Neltuma alba]|uniref:zinc finger CCCH domain-containing protein 56-like n=1 Tax=Neltuma alba TaxID=207710 RepID=UPI0010A3AA3F|nr:zinc finger CCCH domain-containing protein 56-like [Prosopis alba]
MSNASSSACQFDGDEKYPASFDFESEHPSFKRHANPSTLSNSRAQVLNDARTRYFKTQLCRRFRQGICTLGSDCSFAHSVGELRRQELGNDDRRLQESKLCRMFYQGQQCYYGNTCRFLHTRPGSVNSRGNATVEVIPTGHGKRKYDQVESQSGFDESSDAELNPRREPLKTKLCIKWDMKGHCPYGHMCRFAHGQAELGKTDGYSTAEGRVVRTSATATTKVSSGVVSTSSLLQNLKESFSGNYKFNRNELHRISRIYADWI